MSSSLHDVIQIHILFSFFLNGDDGDSDSGDGEEDGDAVAFFISAEDNDYVIICE